MQSVEDSELLLLDRDWQIVLLVLVDNIDGFGDTWRDLQDCSEGRNVSVLAQDAPQVRVALESFPGPIQYAIHQPVVSEHYWASIVAAHTFTAPRTLFIASGARLPPAWDARLVAAAQDHPQASVVSPLLANHDQLSAFSVPTESPNLGVDDIDQWLNDYAPNTVFSLPVLPRTCLLVQGGFWLQSLPTGIADADLVAQLKAKGSWLIATPQVYVDDSGCSGVAVESVAPGETIEQAFAERHPLASFRHALTELDERAEKPARNLACLPVQLHVGHSWGGGLNRWIQNYLASDPFQHHLVLRSIGDRSAFGQQIALYRGADMSVPLRTYALAQPILSTVVSQLEYAHLLDEIVRDFNVESLVVSSFIGHSLDLLNTGLPTTLVMHDFYPFCPALYASFDEPCLTCDKQRVRQCSKDNDAYTFFLHETEEHWDALRSAFFSHLDDRRPTLVAPTQSVFDRYLELAPSVASLERHVVPHGLDDALVDTYLANRSPEPVPSARLKVLVLGRMSREKGADLIYPLIDEAADVAEFVLLGAGEGGERFSDLAGCTVIDDYQMDDLQNQVAAIAPDVALLLSIVPETFSFTLSELWTLGVPVIATRRGAFSDRIQEGQNGWLVQPDTQAVLAVLKTLQEDRTQIARARSVVMAQPVVRATAMVEQYNRVLPGLSGPPVRRYRFPRRSLENPYLAGTDGDQASLFLERTQGVEATYRSVLGEFLQYTAVKVSQSQRVPRLLRRFLAGMFSAAAKMSGRS